MKGQIALVTVAIVVMGLDEAYERSCSGRTQPLLLRSAASTVAEDIRAATPPFAIPATRANCARTDETDMPDLTSLYLLTDPAVRAGGSVIKGLYFAHSREGPNDLVAFWLACSGILEPRPFLSFEFATGLYLLDSDRDGCADQTGVAPRGTIDPADFLESLPTRWWCPQIPAGEPV